MRRRLQSLCARRRAAVDADHPLHRCVRAASLYARAMWSLLHEGVVVGCGIVRAGEVVADGIGGALVLGEVYSFVVGVDYIKCGDTCEYTCVRVSFCAGVAQRVCAVT
jgi:hypothetical protein